jgi:hypothetical protein
MCFFKVLAAAAYKCTENATNCHLREELNFRFSPAYDLILLSKVDPTIC